MAKRYDRTEFRKVSKIVKENRPKKNKDIAILLNTAGCRRPSDAKEFDEDDVAGVAHRLGLRKRRKRRSTVAMREQSVPVTPQLKGDGAALAALILEAKIPKEKKLKMLELVL